MTRFRLATIVAAALALSACATVTDDEVAARVGDQELTFDTIADLLGEADGDAQAVRTVVNQFAISESLRADLASLGVATEPTDVAAGGIGAIETAIGRHVQSWQSVPVDQLADADTRSAYESGTAPIACLAHILTATEAEAQAALDRIGGGESFAEVATVSRDPQSGANGGSLGCLPESEIADAYVPGFAEAAEDVGVGEIIGPVESQFGFHLVTRPPFDQLDQTGLLQLRLSRFAERYDIYVDPRIGQWTGFGEIVPLG